MKNRYLKGAHLSEKKVRELLKLFCEDLTATQIANITGISRITVNAYLKLIRTHIAKYCEEKNPHLRHNGTIAFMPIDNLTMSATVNMSALRKSCYGIFRQDESVHTVKLPDSERNWLHNWLKGRPQADGIVPNLHKLQGYEGIADFNTHRLFRLVDGQLQISRPKSGMDEIDLFWGQLRSRLAKFNGLNGNTLYLHVKESEFRYNYRNQDIYLLLLGIFHVRPLHYSRKQA